MNSSLFISRFLLLSAFLLCSLLSLQKGFLCLPSKWKQTFQISLYQRSRETQEGGHSFAGDSFVNYRGQVHKNLNIVFVHRGHSKEDIVGNLVSGKSELVQHHIPRDATSSLWKRWFHFPQKDGWSIVYRKQDVCATCIPFPAAKAC